MKTKTETETKTFMTQHSPQTAYELRLSPCGGIEGRLHTGEVFSVGADGRGYREAWKFLSGIGEHYAEAVRSAGKLVQRMSANTVNDVAEAVALVLKPVARHTVMAVHPDVKKALCEVATVTAGCIFGIEDAIPDLDEEGDFHPEFVPCPMRAVCEFNGWSERPAETSICNPLYNPGLKGRLKRWLPMLAGKDELEVIAEREGVSFRTAQLYASQVCSEMHVRGRAELRAKLAGKRLE